MQLEDWIACHLASAPLLSPARRDQLAALLGYQVGVDLGAATADEAA